MVGHAAESVMSVLAMEARRFGIHINGYFPKSPEQKDIVRAAGIPRALGFVADLPEGFKELSLFQGRRTPRPGAASTAKELVITKSVEYLNECFGQFDHEFTADGADLYGSLLGETIGNAEDHSGREEWWMSGYLRMVPEQEYGECHITIFNFGDTIFQSLQKLPSASLLRRHIEDLVDHHRKGRLFVRSRWTAESLWTVYALQGGVSRFNAGVEELGHRGNGTVKMINFFLDLGQSQAAPTPPRMSILSGSTQITFDGTYELQAEHTPDGQQQPVIAFNAANDLRRPPDSKYVRRIKDFFPGTLVNMRFYLDRKHLDQVGGSHGTAD